MTRVALFTVNAMLGRVAAARYMRVPTASRYGTMPLTYFVIMTFFTTRRRRHTFCFSQVELFQYLVRIRLLDHKDRPITLTLNLHSEEVLKRVNCDFKFLLQQP